jgi:hypothetical protein
MSRAAMTPMPPARTPTFTPTFAESIGAVCVIVALIVAWAFLTHLLGLISSEVHD